MAAGEGNSHSLLKTTDAWRVLGRGSQESALTPTLLPGVILPRQPLGS